MSDEERVTGWDCECGRRHYDILEQIDMLRPPSEDKMFFLCGREIPEELRQKILKQRSGS